MILVLAGLLSRLSYQMARSPVLPRFAQDLGASPELIGLIVAASTVTGIFIKLPVGALSDILGRKRMMLLACLFFAGPPFLYLFVTHPIQLLLLRFLHGFATAIFSPVAFAYAADLFERGRGEKLGWLAAATDMGATLGPLLGAFVLFYTASYPATYLLVGLLGILPFVMVLRLPKELAPSPLRTGPSRWERFRAGLGAVLSIPPVLVASSMEAAMYVGYGAFLGFFPPYAKNIGLNDAQIGLILGGQLATTMLAKPMAGRLSDRMGRKPMILVGLLLCTILLPFIPQTTGFSILFVLSALFGLGVAIVTPSTIALVADLVKAGQMGSAMGVFGTILDIGEASGPILAGFLIASFGYPWAFALIAALIGGAAVAFALLVREPGQGEK
ncbi:MAG: MFS transporter [Candidatus Methylomirabilales bacterium]